jgi:dipeptidyl aminopeptidase/acylaminoacyl peptidase
MAPAHAACQAVPPLGPAAQAGTRAIDALDLARLRDIGQPDSSAPVTRSPLAVSPDGRSVAFVLVRGNPERNTSCRALVVLPLAGGSPRILDRGGEPITETGAYRGLLVETGYPSLVVPAWSPDGRWLAWLRRDGGVTQLWRAAADGRGARAVTRLATDALRFAWSADSTRLVVAARAAPPDLRAEARSGYLYDERFMPAVAPTPRVKAGAEDRLLIVDPGMGEVRAASAPEIRRLGAEEAFGPSGALAARAADGSRAWIEPVADAPLAPPVLWRSGPGGNRTACRTRACDGGIVGLWPRAGGGFLYLRREGRARGEHALYAWVDGAAPRRVFRTTDWIEGCAPAGAALICLHETAYTPRRIVRLDPATGRLTPLYDPNPEFASLRLGAVIRLAWKNDLGLEARGDLVLPPGYRPGRRLPLIVTQYQSDGFLRGATGDEVPIFALAARGFAVLSTGRPPIVATRMPDIRSFEQANAANARDWAERRSQLSSLETGIALAVARGIADPDRIAITGLSDGATLATFALINRRTFAAASLGSCCLDAITTMVTGGVAYADRMRGLGYPGFTAESRAFWRDADLSRAATARKVPLLLQLADDEYLYALPSFAALRERGWPIEMYVFPGEHHIKFQPAHRLAVYRRNLDWFDFWLNGREDPDPAKSAQYARWRALKAGRP